ncbi:hypothetical protein [Methylotetracoccus oryzae]|uniref:hypothetical protein n=1 Tax=Methylotetracoccus oryzae TaxID=1919059 RepID=UPI0011192E24|nr:hypothetical protein [Methylotetracoccus oryzae]
MRKVLAFLAKEYKAVLPPTIYFLIVFHVTAFTRGLMMESYGVTPAGSAMATVGALILAKVILVFNRCSFLNLFASRPMIFGILWKTLVFGILGSMFQLAEEWVPLLFKFRSASVAAEHLLAEIVWPKFWANHIVLLLWLLIYCIVVEMIRVMGATRVRGIFLGTPSAAPARKRAPHAR